MHSAGSGEFDGERVSVVADGAFVPAGSAVRVVAVAWSPWTARASSSA